MGGRVRRRRLLPGRSSLAAGSRGLDRLLGGALLLAMGLLAAGLTVPSFSVTWLFVLEDKLSVLQSLLLLLEDGEYLLCLILFAFTVVFPFGKLVTAAWLWRFTQVAPARLRRALGWLDVLGRWSMLDVFVVALVIVSVKASWVGEVTLHAGFYLFVAAILVSGLALRRIARLAQAAAERNRPGRSRGPSRPSLTGF